MKCQVKENPMKTNSLNAQPHNLKSKALSFVKIRNEKNILFYCNYNGILSKNILF